MGTLLKGMLIGFSISAPVGPIAILYVRRTLASGRLSGMVSAIGCALADATYGTLAAFGFSTISSMLVEANDIFGVVGGVALCVFGIRCFRDPVTDEQSAVKTRSLLSDAFSTYVLTLSSPITILYFVAVFAGMRLGQDGGSPGILVLGVFLGSVLWALALVEIVHRLRKKFSVRQLFWLNRCSGAAITAFGLFSVLRSFPWF